MTMELTLSLVTKIAVTVALVWLVRFLTGAYESMILEPRRLRSKLKKQGIRGPPLAFLVGNLVEMTRAVSQARKARQGEQGIVHNVFSILFPSLEKWTKEYGKIFMFSLGNIQCLHINEAEVAKEMIKCTSLDYGKPDVNQKLIGPLLGEGILSANGAVWAHERKTLTPMFTIESVKSMMEFMVESAEAVVGTWKAEIESKGGVAEITVDEHLINFTTDIMSKACFGRDNADIGNKIFFKLKGIFNNVSKMLIYLGIPLARYLPTKRNIETYRLVRETRRMILQAVQERKKAASTHHDILESILLGADNPSKLSGQSAEQFIVDNLKNVYLAGYETVAVSSSWTLMLLAIHPEWQDQARAEVLEICNGQYPDHDALRMMKTLTMVFNESLRLYSPLPSLVRQPQRDMMFGNITVPKGCLAWVSVSQLHQDPEIWGPDANDFNPQRFANGVSGACKHPSTFLPFGTGNRNCLGQNFAFAEMKILFALILSNFSFSLSPNYKYSPIQRLLLQPEHGVSLIFKKL